jgi:hypothetical protein
MATKPKETETEVLDARAPEVEITALAHQRVTHDGLMYDASDVDIPKGNIVQKISQIDGPLGSLVVDQKHVIVLAEVPIDVYVVKAKKAWREDLPYGETPRLAFTEAERDDLVADGAKLVEWADISLMIPAPGDEFDEAAFPFPFGNRNYCLARLNVAKDAYRMTYKRLAMFSACNPDKSFRERLWTFESQLLSKGKYSWHAPSLSISAAQPDPEVLEFIKSF